MLIERAKMLAIIRSHFEQAAILEVETPLLSKTAGTDPYLDPLASVFTGPNHPSGLKQYLQTSPEFFMKRLLVSGSGSIYQICKAFRDGEVGKRHNPEFSLLEWYELDIDHHQLMSNLSVLIEKVFSKKLPVEKITYQALFQAQLSVDPLNTTVKELEAVAVKRGIALEGNCSLDEWLDLLMVECLEKSLGQDTLCFIYDYPASQASLARLSVDDTRVANRFELYYQGVELANGYYELADAAEQKARFMADNEQRQKLGKSTLPIDDAFLNALETGLPNCSGVAVGLDRLLMLKMGYDKLSQVMPFPFS